MSCFKILLKTKPFCKMFLTANIGVCPSRVCNRKNWQQNLLSTWFDNKNVFSNSFFWHENLQNVFWQGTSVSAQVVFARPCSHLFGRKITTSWTEESEWTTKGGFVHKWHQKLFLRSLNRSPLAALALLQCQFITWLPFTADSHYQRGSRKETSEEEIFVGPPPHTWGCTKLFSSFRSAKLRLEPDKANSAGQHLGEPQKRCQTQK